MRLRSRIALFVGTVLMAITGAVVVAAPASASAECTANPPTGGRVCVYNNPYGTNPEMYYWTGLSYNQCVNMGGAVDNATKAIKNGTGAGLTLYTGASCSGIAIVSVWSYSNQSCLYASWNTVASPCNYPTGSSFRVWQIF